MFGGELEVTEKPESGKSKARLYHASLRKMAADECKMIQRIAQILEGLDDFCRSKKNMFLPIREGIAKAKEEIKMLSLSNESDEIFLISMESFLGLQVSKDKEKEVEARSAKRLAGFVNEECPTDLELGGKSTLDPTNGQESQLRVGRNLLPRSQRRRGRMPQSNRRNGVEVSVKKELPKERKNKPEAKKPVRLKPPRSEAILLNPWRGLATRRF